MDIGSISAALASLKAAKDIGQAMLELKADASIQAKIIDLQSQILSTQSHVLDAQSEQLDLQKKLAATESELTRLRSWEAERQRYKLIEPSPGVLVYCLKDDLSSEEPIHWLCANCYIRAEKSFLQCTMHEEAIKRYHCQICNSQISFVNQNYSPPKRFYI